MLRLIGFLLCIVISGNLYAQTCTISCGPTPCTVQWTNSPATCANGGTIVIPSGITLEFDNVADTWTGTVIEVYGHLLINQADITVNTSITVKSGGLVTLAKRLSLGTSASNPVGCNYTMIIESGGNVDVTDSGSDRLYICGVPIMKGSGSCNTCGGTNSGTCPYDFGPPEKPYCEPTSGTFQGPLGYSKDGYDSALPIELLFFKGSKGLNKISLSWATASELNFDYFDIEKSADGKTFLSIAKIKGNGTTNERNDYSFEDEKPYIGKNYYRMTSVDFDGYTEVFNIVMIDFDGNKRFSVSPNPSDGVTFTAETNFIPVSKAYVAIYSTLGSEIARFEVTGSKSTLSLPVKLESGVYYAKFISSELTSTNRVMVK